MSMHLALPALTTTSTRKRKEKITKSQQEELERGWRDRNVRLKQIGLQKETFEQYLVWVYGKGKKEKTQKGTWKKTSSSNASAPAKICQNNENNYKREVKKNEEHLDYLKSSNGNNYGKVWVTGPCTTKQTPTYTGSKIIGIGTMHKSNAVPIFSDEEAKDISRMRR